MVSPEGDASVFVIESVFEIGLFVGAGVDFSSDFAKPNNNSTIGGISLKLVLVIPEVPRATELFDAGCDGGVALQRGFGSRHWLENNGGLKKMKLRNCSNSAIFHEWAHGTKLAEILDGASNKYAVVPFNVSWGGLPGSSNDVVGRRTLHLDLERGKHLGHSSWQIGSGSTLTSTSFPGRCQVRNLFPSHENIQSDNPSSAPVTSESAAVVTNVGNGTAADGQGLPGRLTRFESISGSDSFSSGKKKSKAKVVDKSRDEADKMVKQKKWSFVQHSLLSLKTKKLRHVDKQSTIIVSSDMDNVTFRTCWKAKKERRKIQGGLKQ
ncbi:hypothetical protein DL93DRAFT_2161687 [Clavulina sp. PMI_390]|nr:hypothetical protein DL93DRAFT_2161687 [Clavulina sp. PMI_390]